jgi:hypothetical protein
MAAAVLTLLLAGCGAGQPCAGILVEGACWVGEPGVTVSAPRVSAILARARALWGVPGDVEGWTVSFTAVPIEVDGQPYDGYCWPGRQEILVNPLDGRDCIETSFVYHELGHAWGFGHDDLRMFHEWRLMDEAARASEWSGCAGGLP